MNCYVKEIPEVFKDGSLDESDENKESQSFIAASSRDKSVTIWNLNNASKLAELKLPSGTRGGNKSGEYTCFFVFLFYYCIDDFYESGK